MVIAWQCATNIFFKVGIICLLWKCIIWADILLYILVQFKEFPKKDNIPYYYLGWFQHVLLKKGIIFCISGILKLAFAFYLFLVALSIQLGHREAYLEVELADVQLISYLSFDGLFFSRHLVLSLIKYQSISSECPI